MTDKKTALVMAVELVGKLLETEKGFDKLNLIKSGDEAMQALGQRVKTLAHALIDPV